jgi:pyruvate dehydrogenase E2 component (dihydrolipoamide acetyltransferase)
MPQMGYDMQEGTLVRWLKDEGSVVEIGEPIAEIETDKAIVEFESYASGVLQRKLVQEGVTVPVGQPIALVGEESELPVENVFRDDGESRADDAGLRERGEAPDRDEAPGESPGESEESHAIPLTGPAGEQETPADEPPVGAVPGVRASPVARRMAEERGIDLSQLRGTGPGGRITKDDILAFEGGTGTEIPQPPEEEAPAEQPPIPLPGGHDGFSSEAVASPPDEAPAVAEVFEPAPESGEALDEAETVIAEPMQPLDLAETIPVEPEQPLDETETVAVELAPALDEAETVPVEPEPAVEEIEAASEKIPLSRMRQQIARVTVRSKQEKPHFYISADVDMGRAMELRKQINADVDSEGVHVTVNDLIIKACVETLKTYPIFNASYADDGIQMNDEINVGVAMSGEEGLIVPAIMDCARRTLGDIATASKDLADRAASGTLRPQEYSGGTFAISNLGMFDVTSFTAIIQPPQTAVLAVGTVRKAAVVKNDEVVVGQMMTATLSADHRVVDGAEGARFIGEVKRLLESPLSFLV